MRIPDGYTEEEVLAAIQMVGRMYLKRFAFPGCSSDDLYQQAMLFAVEGMERFDGRRPLEHYLSVHVRNRLSNFRRNNFRRSDAPCKRCHRGKPCGPEGRLCDEFIEWQKRQQDKLKVRLPRSFGKIEENDKSVSGPPVHEHDTEIAEVLRLIDEELPITLRPNLLRMRAGVSVPKKERLQVQAAVAEILGRAGLEIRGVIEDEPALGSSIA